MTNDTRQRSGDSDAPASTSPSFVLSLVHTAAVHFGDVADPGTGERHAPNLPLAQQMIDILAMLEEKTRGNLSAEERQLIDQVLYELRMRFVEVSRAPAAPRRSRASSSLDGAVALACRSRHLSRHRDVARGADDRVRVRRLPLRPIRTTPGCARRSTWTCPDRQRILVDTSPDLRQQAITHRIMRVDAVIYTHSHADHILGLDELRRFNARAGRPRCSATPRRPRGTTSAGRFTTCSTRRRGSAAASRSSRRI